MNASRQRLTKNVTDGLCELPGFTRPDFLSPDEEIRAIATDWLLTVFDALWCRAAEMALEAGS